MFDEPLNPPTLTGSESTAEWIKSWLIDEKETQSGLLGVNNALEIVSVRTFQHGLTRPTLSMALGEALRAKATAVVVYGIATGGERPSFDAALFLDLTNACEYLNVTLLDVVTFSPAAPRTWSSARQQNLL